MSQGGLVRDMPPLHSNREDAASVSYEVGPNLAFAFGVFAEKQVLSVATYRRLVHRYR